MAAIAAQAHLKRSRSGRREAIFPMFVAEQRQTIWSRSVHTGYLPANVSLSLPLVSVSVRRRVPLNAEFQIVAEPG